MDRELESAEKRGDSFSGNRFLGFATTAKPRRHAYMAGMQSACSPHRRTLATLITSPARRFHAMISLGISPAAVDRDPVGRFRLFTEKTDILCK
jgi:hypothetical protein